MVLPLPLLVLVLLLVLLLTRPAEGSTKVCGSAASVDYGDYEYTVAGVQTYGGIVYVDPGSACFDVFSTVGSIGAVTFDGECPAANSTGNRRGSTTAAKTTVHDRVKSVKAALAAEMERVRLLTVTAATGDPGGHSKRRRQFDGCMLNGYHYLPSVSVVEMCPWLSSTANCNVIPGVLNLTSILQPLLCDWLDEWQVTSSNTCFRTFQLLLCSLVDANAHSYHSASPLISYDVSASLEIWPTCDFCDEWFDNCYDTLYLPIPATLDETKSQTDLYNFEKAGLCSVLQANCSRDCDCSYGAACIVNGSASVCMAECEVTSSPADCAHGADSCQVGRVGNYPDHTCDCAASYSAPHDTTLEYCSEYSGNSCCTAEDELAHTTFTNPCDKLTSKSCLNLLKRINCAMCSPDAMDYYMGGSSKDQFTVCQSMVDAVYTNCHKQQICLPTTRCLTESDCQVMENYVSPTKDYDWSSQEHFQDWLEDVQGFYVVDDKVYRDAVCFGGATANGPLGRLVLLLLSLFLVAVLI